MHGAEHNLTSLQTLDVLLSQGAQLDKIDVFGNDPLSIALEDRGGDTYTINHIMTRYHALDYPFRRDLIFSALESAKGRHRDCTKVMRVLDYGIELNALNKDGYSALHYCIKHDSLSALESLCRHPDININIEAQDGLTALQYAAIHGPRESLKILIDHGVDLEAKGSKQSYTALGLAAQAHRLDILREVYISVTWAPLIANRFTLAIGVRSRSMVG